MSTLPTNNSMSALSIDGLDVVISLTQGADETDIHDTLSPQSM